jgi:hypothetical protein
MPRQARINAAAALQDLISRRIERRKTLQDDQRKERFRRIGVRRRFELTQAAVSISGCRGESLPEKRVRSYF